MSATLPFISVGSGPPVLLVHGTGQDHRMWLLQIESLSSRYQMIAPDMLGCGDASRLTADSYCNATEIVRVLDCLGLERAHIVGHSRGGRSVIDLALTYPDRVLSLVLVGANINGLAPDEEYKELGDTVRRICAEQSFEAAIEYWFGTALFAMTRNNKALVRLFRQMIERFDPSHWLAKDQDLIVPNAVDRLGEILCPALVVAGEHDIPHFLNAAKRLKSGIPNAELVTILGAGHVCSMEKPEDFNVVLGRFLSSLG